MPPRLPHREPGTPDTRGPLRYIWWLARVQSGRVLLGAAISTAWMGGLTLPPYLISRAIDDSIAGHAPGRLVGWVAAFLLVGIVLAWLGIQRHRTMTFVRMDAGLRTSELVLRKVCVLGAGFRSTTGEVVTVGSSDAAQIANVLTTTGPGVASVVSYGLVAVLLWRISPPLAWLVLLGVPVVAVLIGPLLRRLERAESGYRTEQGSLTTRAADVAAGLRVLAGFGGRHAFAARYRQHSGRLRERGYRAASVGSWVEAASGSLPGLLAALVLWVSARMAAAGAISIGELVAVTGYTAMLQAPVWFLVEGAYDVIRGRIAALRVIAVLARPVPAAGGLAAPTGPADLHDPDSGVLLPAGGFACVAAADPAAAAAVVDRLGGYGPTGATWGGVPLRDMDRLALRQRVLVAEAEAFLFAGAVRAVVGGSARAAVRIAAADDIVRALPRGLDAELPTQARTLSGGERQRIRLARAVAAEAEILLLVEPTSAVDAHTETRIAEGLATARRGRTTLIATTSPTLLRRADTVYHLVAGRVAGQGTHRQLLECSPAYRELVARRLAA